MVVFETSKTLLFIKCEKFYESQENSFEIMKYGGVIHSLTSIEKLQIEK